MNAPNSNNRDTSGLDLVVDVGANHGDFSIDVAVRNPDVTVLAIEPIPSLCKEILKRARKAKLDRIIVENVAIDLREREATFNVADHHDLGVSSLLSFRQQDIARDEYWKHRKDLYYDKQIVVKVVPLSRVIEKLRPRTIKFIKIDAQGLDMDVLDSLGPYLEITEAGMLEVPATRRTSLYEGETHDLGSALRHLESIGFEPYAIKPNDHAANEYNIFFCRRGLVATEVEEALRLKGIHLYDGKHYWHHPSDRWLEQSRLTPPLSPDPSEGSPAETVSSLFNASTGIMGLIRPDRKILWAGHSPPLHWIDVSAQIFDPAHDYRMPAGTHQSYDVVYLIERDLASMKAWPQVIDEALRLLKPEGHLILRTSNSPLMSIFELMSFINAWGAFEVRHEIRDVNGILQIVLQNCASRPRDSSISGLSFGVITNGQRPSYLKALFDSILALHNPAGLPIEILVCGPADVHAQFVRQGYPLTHVAEPDEFSDLGWITRKKNLLVSHAQFAHIVVAHDRYCFAADFLIKLSEFGGDFSAISCRQTRPDGRRFPDWVTMGAEWSWTNPAVLNYGDWSRHVYINGGIIVARTEVLRQTPWNELLFWNQAEDVELTRRLRHAGHVPRFARHLHAITQTMREGFMGGFHAVPLTWAQYPMPGPVGSDATRPIPRSRSLFHSNFASKFCDELLEHGVYVGESWQQERRIIKLPAGVWGDITLHPKSKQSYRRLLTLGCKNPPNDLRIFVNDKSMESSAKISSRNIRIRLNKSLAADGKVLRIQLRSDSTDVRLRSIGLSLPGTLLVSAGIGHVRHQARRLGRSLRKRVRGWRNK